jgi:hypothetical protein
MAVRKDMMLNVVQEEAAAPPFVPGKMTRGFSDFL